jgi:hypothetical protein
MELALGLLVGDENTNVTMSPRLYLKEWEEDGTTEKEIATRREDFVLTSLQQPHNTILHQT